MRLISAAEIEAAGDWRALVDALEAGHRLPAAATRHQLQQDGENSWVSLMAWAPGGALALKSMTIFPGNDALDPPRRTINGAVLLFDAATGEVAAVFDGALLTEWKTVGDSALGADLLARPDIETLLVVGAGTIGARLPEAYLAVRPSIRRVLIWNRGSAKAEALAARLSGALPADIEAVADLEAAARQADAIACATMATEPVIRGDWLKPGAHLDLIGAYRPDMREADDEAMRRGRIFVDARDTTLAVAGELIDPIAAGAIAETDILGDHYDLAGGAPGRLSPDDVTVFKNGGGAHLDLMVAQFFLDRLQGREDHSPTT